MLSKIKRPLMAVVLVMGLGMTIASAYDYCSPCAPVAPRPVAVYTPPVPAPVTVAASCDPCGAPVAAATTYSSANVIPVRTTSSVMMPSTTVIPASQVSNYAVNRDLVGPMSNQVTYIIPSMHGTIESSTLPVGDNEVDRWYAHHSVVGNQVVAY